MRVLYAADNHRFYGEKTASDSLSWLWKNPRMYLYPKFTPIQLTKENESVSEKTEAAVSSEHPVKERILAFCNTPRSKEEIAEYLGIRSMYYVVSKYLKPMCAANPLSMTHPDKPKSRHQKYFTVRKSEMD